MSSLDSQISQMTLALQAIVKANVQAFVEYQQTFKSMLETTSTMMASQVKNDQEQLSKEVADMVRSIKEGAKSIID